MFNSQSEIVLSTQDAYSTNFYACEYVGEGVGSQVENKRLKRFKFYLTCF